MNEQVFPLTDQRAYERAGASDLIELLPVPGGHPLFLPKALLQALVYGIARQESIHLSGPTGSAKSSLLEALEREERNFTLLCRYERLPERPLRLFPVEMAIYEAPGELYQRRALRDGSTFDEPSPLVQALAAAVAESATTYPLIWLREMGRVHTASVQGGLLNLMSRTEIVLPDGRRLDGGGIAWIADSNYQAEEDSTHTLVVLDDALKRRFTLNLTLGYLSAEQETQVLLHLCRAALKLPQIEDDLVLKVVRLGQIIRRHRHEGELLSVPPPTLYGELAFLRMAARMPRLGPPQIARATLLGNASAEDENLIPGVLNEAFGLHLDDDDDPTLGGNLF